MPDLFFRGVPSRRLISKGTRASAPHHTVPRSPAPAPALLHPRPVALRSIAVIFSTRCQRPIEQRRFLLSTLSNNGGSFSPRCHFFPSLRPIEQRRFLPIEKEEVGARPLLDSSFVVSIGCLSSKMVEPQGIYQSLLCMFVGSYDVVNRSVLVFVPMEGVSF